MHCHRNRTTFAFVDDAFFDHVDVDIVMGVGAEVPVLVLVDLADNDRAFNAFVLNFSDAYE